jgi:SAM-dependent methyltransferase
MLDRKLDIVDIGCGMGIVRSFVDENVPAQWTGLDWRLQRESLSRQGYSHVHECDFDKRLPLEDSSADVITFLHVIEHLPRPAHALGEIARILRPRGLLLAGSPVAPAWIARLRQRQYQRELREGRRNPGEHIHCFWPGKWRRLLNERGFQTELVTGAYLLRWSGSALENSKWWLRLNQLWGAAFPSLGGEVYVMARAPSQRKDRESTEKFD